MPKMDVINQEGKVVSSIELKDEIFGIEPNQQCMYDAVVMQLARHRTRPSGKHPRRTVERRRNRIRS